MQPKMVDHWATTGTWHYTAPRKLDLKTARYKTYSTGFSKQECHVDAHWQSRLFADEHLVVITSHSPVETTGPVRGVVMRNSWSCDPRDTSLLSPLGIMSLGCGAASGYFQFPGAGGPTPLPPAVLPLALWNHYVRFIPSKTQSK